MNMMLYIMISIILVYVVIMFFSVLKILKKKSIKKIILFDIISFIVLLGIMFICYYSNNIPTIKLRGDKIVKINVFDNYVDAGYDVINSSKNMKVTVENNVDSDKVGIYDVEYTIKHFNKEIKEVRKVQVVDEEKPTIKLLGETVITLGIDSKYNESGYTASDNYDGDITKKVKVTDNIKDEIGKYEVIYTVEDSSGNVFSTKRIINKINDNNGVIYLTFDDGPSSATSKILDILKENNVKATFFIVNYSKWYEDVVKRIVDEGHTIALHSYTHNYKLIYSSEEAYFDDLLKLKSKVKETTGIDANIIRFPGGSSNTVSKFNKGIMTRLVKKVKEEGFHYFDWNVDSKDAGGAKDSSDVYNNVMNNLNKNRNNVVLMHDLGHNIKTINALTSIIKDSKSKGYTFSKITYDTPMVVHGVNN